MEALFRRVASFVLGDEPTHLQAAWSVHSFWRLHQPQNGSRRLRHSLWKDADMSASLESEYKGCCYEITHPQKPVLLQSAALTLRNLLGVKTSTSMLFSCITVPGRTISPSGAARKVSTTSGRPSVRSTFIILPWLVPTRATMLSPIVVPVTAVPR